MDAKKCFKCGKKKTRTEFYRHPQMADGLLGKCKDCTRKDTGDRVKRLQSDPLWVVKERARHREKSRKYRDEGRAKKQEKHGHTDQVKRLANTVAGNAIRDGRLIPQPCEVCGKKKTQGHHEDYSKPLDVVWLCTRHHADRHIYLRDCKILGIDPSPIKQFIKELKP